MNDEEIDSYISRNFIVCFQGADGALVNELHAKFRMKNYYTLHSVYNTGPGVVILFPKEYYMLVKHDKIDNGDQHVLSAVLRDKKNEEEFTITAPSIPCTKGQHILYTPYGQGIVFL